MMFFEATAHDKDALCRQAPEFEEIVRQADLSSFECCGDLFLALVQSIVSQQLAVKAADAIFRRVEALLGKVTAERLFVVATGRNFEQPAVQIFQWKTDHITFFSVNGNYAHDGHS